MPLLVNFGFAATAACAALQLQMAAAGGVAVTAGLAAAGGAVCPVLAQAREFLATLGVDDLFLDPAHDRCYCERCYRPGYSDTITNEGPTVYVLPRGWVRFGLRAGGDPRAQKHQIFTKWSASFHGVKSKPVLQSILDCGMLMKPGDKLMDGTKLRSTKCAGR